MSGFIKIVTISCDKKSISNWGERLFLSSLSISTKGWKGKSDELCYNGFLKSGESGLHKIWGGLTIATILTTSLLFTACDGGGGGGSTAGTATSTAGGVSGTGIASSSAQPMVQGQPMTIAPGQSIVNVSIDSKVEIIVKGGVRTATLLEGTASIQ